MVWCTLCTADSTYRGSELVMPSVTRADMGAYMCIARNGVPPATSKIFKLIVNCKWQYISGEEKTSLFDKRTIKVCTRCSWRCLGSWDLLRLMWHSWVCPWFFVFPEATHKASRGPLKDAMSVQKTLQGFEIETRELLGGTKEKLFPTRGHLFALWENNLLPIGPPE